MMCTNLKPRAVGCGQTSINKSDWSALNECGRQSKNVLVCWGRWRPVYISVLCDFSSQSYIHQSLLLWLLLPHTRLDPFCPTGEFLKLVKTKLILSFEHKGLCSLEHFYVVKSEVCEPPIKTRWISSPSTLN